LVWGANWACFRARLAEPFPEAHSPDRRGRNWALARASDVSESRQSWTDYPGLSDVVASTMGTTTATSR
jgi:hypothetical protein